MNETRITVHGNVVSEPVERQGRNGSIFTTFRIATTPYRRTADGRYVDGDTSFYSVIAFNALAANAATALRKGQPVIVEGNVAMKQYVGSDGQPRLSPEIDADHIGHDLSWGRATFERVSRAAALGQDRTADPEARAALRALNDGSPDAVEQRPAHVDANGVVGDDYEGDVAEDADAGSEGPGEDALATGDPETDDYEVVERFSA